jgi:hypothetical protein
MGFSPMKLKPESGANRIKSADDAYSFMMHMQLSYQNKPHWQAARQAIDQACMSDDSVGILGRVPRPEANASPARPKAAREGLASLRRSKFALLSFRRLNNSHA